MKISILCSDPKHPVNAYLEKWIFQNQSIHEIILARRKSDLPGGDILFLISCLEILKAPDREKYEVCLVLHASDLPKGRGWSPHVWAIAAGAEEITVSLLEADDEVDSGRIWKKLIFEVPKHALWHEINSELFEAEISLINFAVECFRDISPVGQSQVTQSGYYPRRTPEDSKIDPAASIEKQFDLIRVCDPVRYPAFFDLHGYRYKLIVEKLDDQPDQD